MWSTLNKEVILQPVPPQGNSRIENVCNFLKQTFTKFLESCDLEWDNLLPFACYCYNIFPSSIGTESPFFLMFWWDPVEEQLTHLNNCSKYCGNNKGKIILEDLHKLWKQHTAHLKELFQRIENHTEQNHNSGIKFEIGKPIIVKSNACHWHRFLILLVESWRIVIISGTVHWFWLKTSFHPLLWTSSGLTGSWKLSTYIRFGSLRSVKSVTTRGNWKPKKCWKC